MNILRHSLFSHKHLKVSVSERTNKWDLLRLVKNINIYVGGYISIGTAIGNVN